MSGKTKKNILVTGGAGFIGSHTVDLLVERGYRVRILDSLERPTHLAGVPSYLNPGAEFMRGDMRSVDDVARALWGMDAVIHLAATGGFTPDVVRYFDTNSIGTANLLGLVQDPRYRVRKLVVASSVGIYGEGAYRCPECGPQRARPRSVQQLEQRQWEPTCPTCERPLLAVATAETEPPSPEKAYSISKFDQERLVLGFGRDRGIACCALRYFLTYGPRQSLTNPYTGVISIFASRIFNSLPPVLFEDGRQTRDFVWVGDVARANLMALENDAVDGEVFNVGSGEAHAIGDVAELLAGVLGKPEVGPDLPGEFRPGESRHIFADITKLRALGFEPTVSLREGIERYIEWVRGQGEIREYFSEAMAGLGRSGVVRRSAVAREEPLEHSLSVVIPVYNEAGNVESIVRYVLAVVETFVDEFELVLVNDGSHDGSGLILDRLAAEDSRISVYHHPFNIGYGGAHKTGFRNTTKNWVVVVPADHQFDARDLEKFLEARKSADVIGSFRIDRKDTLRRRVISWLYNAYMRRVYGVPLRDLNWIKLFRRRIVSEIEIESRGFAVDAEIVVKAQRKGYRIAEIPVVHHPRTWGNPTGVSLKNLYKTARELLRIKGMVKRIETIDGEGDSQVGDDAAPGGEPPGVDGKSGGAVPGLGRTSPPNRGP